MSKILDPTRAPKPHYGTQCLACQKKPGTPMYGIVLCQECDEEIFVKPYGKKSDPNEMISSISLRVTKKHPKFDSLEVFYRFSEGDTLVSGRKGVRSIRIVILPGIQPMTQEFLNTLVDKIDLYLTFS